MKVTIEQALNASAQLNLLNERTVNSTGEVLRGVTIPASKAKTGYWLGRLTDKIASIQKSVNPQIAKLRKELGVPKKLSGKMVDGKLVEQFSETEFTIKPENENAYLDAVQKIMDIEEEIAIEPFEFEMFEGIEFPASFWVGMQPFIKEPK